MIVLVFSLTDAPALAPQRTRAGWTACLENGALWLRCPAADAAECAALPAVARYRCDSRGLLTPLEGSVPVAQAPAGPWLPLTEVFPVHPATPNFPGRTRQRLNVSLVRTEREQPAQAVLLPLAQMLPWVEQAPRIRLERLQFAAAADGRALVKGTPLPPVPGAVFYFAGAMALPCGWDFAPHLWHGWVEKALAIPAGGLCLVHEDARLELIGAEGFAPLTLAAVRRTVAALNASH